MILDDGHTLPHGHYEGINSGGGAAPEISAGADLRNSHTQLGLQIWGKQNNWAS